MEIACSHTLNGSWGGEYRNNVLLGAAMGRGRLVELNGRSGGAKEGRKFGETKE
jgi:hypothetical protein